MRSGRAAGSGFPWPEGKPKCDDEHDGFPVLPSITRPGLQLRLKLAGQKPRDVGERISGPLSKRVQTFPVQKIEASGLGTSPNGVKVMTSYK